VKLGDKSPLVPQSTTDIRAKPERKAHGRNRITNGRDVLPNVDGRSIIARRFRDIVNAMIADHGGADQCSESRMQLIRRFAAAAVLAEQMEAVLAQGNSIDIREHALLCSTDRAGASVDHSCWATRWKGSLYEWGRSMAGCAVRRLAKTPQCR
jgi:hypothetical protein